MNASRKKVNVDEIQPVTTCEAKNFAKSRVDTAVGPNLRSWPAGNAIPDRIQSIMPIQAAKSPTHNERRRSPAGVADSMDLPLPAFPTAANTGHANHKTSAMAIGNKT